MSRLISACANVVLVVCSIALAFLGLEAFLWVTASTHTVQASPPASVIAPPPPASSNNEIVIPPDILAAARSRQDMISMPESWRRRRTKVAGARHAVYWHGILHVYNSDGMRWVRPFPEKREEVYRIIVVGDSLTYGEGLTEEWRFTNLLDQWLSQQYRIEVLNLGANGLQSEDVLRVTRRYLPILKPDLVIYAVCLNDFLPSGRGQYSDNAAYPFPAPEALKNAFMRHTRVGAFLSEQYDAALRRLHLRADFFDDILTDFDGYQQRFASDVAEMNRVVRSAGVPPLVGMVIDQDPLYGHHGYRIAKIAESALATAGADVIDTEDYYRRYHGNSTRISRWEGHPNEVANYIWASMLSNELRARPDLQAFRR
jgi:GDSL-like Lipase/Acylhydrolase family